MTTLLAEAANASKPVDTIIIKTQFNKDASNPNESQIFPKNSENVIDPVQYENFTVVLKGVPILHSTQEEIVRCWEAATGNEPYRMEIGEELVYMCVSNIKKEKIPKSFLMKRQKVEVEVDPFFCCICNIPKLTKIDVLRKAIHLSLGDFKFKLDHQYLDTALIYFESDEDMKQFINWVERDLIFVLGNPIKISKVKEIPKEQEIKAKSPDSLEEIPFWMEKRGYPNMKNMEMKSEEELGIIAPPRMMMRPMNGPKVYPVPSPIIPTAHRAFMPVRPSYQPTQETVESIVRRGTKRKHNPTRMIEIINTTKKKEPQETGVLWMFTTVADHQIPFIAIHWSRFYIFYKVDQDQPQILDRTIREKFQPSKCKRDRRDPNSESEWREVDRNQVAMDYHIPLPQSGHYDTLYTYVSWWSDLGLVPPAKKRRTNSVSSSHTTTTAPQGSQGLIKPLTNPFVTNGYIYAPEMPITKKQLNSLVKILPSTPLQAIPLSNQQSFFLSSSSFVNKGLQGLTNALSIPATTSPPPMVIPSLTPMSPSPVSSSLEFEKSEEAMVHT